MLFQSIFCCFSGNSNIIFISGFTKQNIQGRYKQKSYLIIEVALVEHLVPMHRENQAPSMVFIMWAHLESNQAPTDYESVALTE